MPNMWTINAGDVTGGGTKDDVVGCHITTNDDDSAYEFTRQQHLGSSLNDARDQFVYSPVYLSIIGLRRVHVDDYGQHMRGSAGGNQAEGDWENNALSITAAEEGTWTAQAGGGAEEDIPGKEDAASASG